MADKDEEANVPFLPSTTNAHDEDDDEGKAFKRRRSYSLIVWLVSIVCVVVIGIGALFFLQKQSHGERRGASSCARFDFQCQADSAQSFFQQLQDRQSKTYEEAEQEYKRRYNRTPPPGFDQWFAFAMHHNATLIDEYDQMEADLSPFRSLQPEQIKERMDSAWENNRYLTTGQEFLAYISIQNKTMSKRPATREGLENATAAIFRPISDRLPNLTILFNHWDEPKVILPTNDDEARNVVQSYDLSESSTWYAVREPCGQKTTTATFKSARPAQFTAQGHETVCSLPAHAEVEHGFFGAPSSFYPFQQLVPILSNAKLTTMGDILMPSPCYYASEYLHSELVDQIPFLEKQKSVYWRGSLTGRSMADARHWLESHRQRFVFHANKILEHSQMAKQFDRSTFLQFLSLPFGSQKSQKRLQQLAELPDNVFDVAATDFIHCQGALCATIAESIRTTGKSPPEDSFRHQVAVDLDGEGMSCRFYRLLRSNSVPLKQTIYREAHNDRLVPFVHFIPLSLGMDELIPLLTWLFNDEAGQRTAEQIAQQGQEWANSSLRQIDASIYMYRLLLEYAQLMTE